MKISDFIGIKFFVSICNYKIVQSIERLQSKGFIKILGNKSVDRNTLLVFILNSRNKVLLNTCIYTMSFIPPHPK